MIKNFIAEQKQLRAQQFNPGLTVTSFTAFVFWREINVCDSICDSL